MANIFTGVLASLQKFETSVLNWVNSEEVVLESVGTELVAAVETIVVAFKPAVVADIKAILTALPAEFLSGSTFSNTVEEIMNQADADLKAILTAAKPQVLEALVGVLVQALAHV